MNILKSLPYPCVILILGALVIPGEGIAQEPSGNQRVVLVVPFENLSTERHMITYEIAPAQGGVSSTTTVAAGSTGSGAVTGARITSTDGQRAARNITVDRYSVAPRALLEDMLINSGKVQVIERQRVDAMMLEGEFAESSGLVDSTSAVKMGSMLGATHLVMGTVLTVNANERTFQGYGVSTRQVQVRSRIRVRVIELGTGQVVASQTYAGERTYASSQFGGMADLNVVDAILEATVEKIRQDEVFLDRLAGIEAEVPVEMVSVVVQSAQDHADILIDGIYYGSTPSTIAFPKDVPVTIRLELSGYQPWERKIIPGRIQRIAPNLIPE